MKSDHQTWPNAFSDGNVRRRARPAEVVEEVIAVGTGPAAADLDQPRPDLGRLGVDGDRSRRHELGHGQRRIAGHGGRDFVGCRAPSNMPSPVQRRRHEQRKIGDDVNEFAEQAAAPCMASSDPALRRPHGSTVDGETAVGSCRRRQSSRMGTSITFDLQGQKARPNTRASHTRATTLPQ